LCTVTIGIPESWGSPKGPSDSEASAVSPRAASPFIKTMVPPSQSSPDLTPVVKGDASPIPVDVHPLQPRVEEVFVSVQFLVNPTLLAESDASFDHVVSIHNPAPSE
jgi:hypothetical protein